MKLYVINRDNERIYLDTGGIKTRKDIPYLFCVNCRRFSRDSVHIEEDKYIGIKLAILFGMMGFLVIGPIGAFIGGIIAGYFGLKEQAKENEIIKNFDS